jgi:hypothetical protein
MTKFIHNAVRESGRNDGHRTLRKVFGYAVDRIGTVSELCLQNALRKCR